MLAVRWTIGDVSLEGFEILANSIIGARYIVAVNTIDIETAHAWTGAASSLAEWRDCTNLLPEWVHDRIDQGMAEGVAWKFVPVRFCEDQHVLSLDNDVVLWGMPESIRLWLRDGNSLLIAEDVKCRYGAFASQCPVQPRDSGVTGFPPGWDIERRLRELLHGTRMTSECDEQGLQVAMITSEPHRLVTLEEVSISGYFRPHLLELGSCGAHFVGVNPKRSASTWQGRSIEQYAHEFWNGMRPQVEQHIRTAGSLGRTFRSQ